MSKVKETVKQAKKNSMGLGAEALLGPKILIGKGANIGDKLLPPSDVKYMPPIPSPHITIRNQLPYEGLGVEAVLFIMSGILFGFALAHALKL